MIAGIKGRIFDISPGEVYIDTGNGFIIRIIYPISSYSILKNKDEEVLLYTVFRQKEEESVLYGFVSMKEKMFFEKLISISGIGGKIALSLISAFSIRELTDAINSGEVDRLISIPGIGKKTAQRIILELTGKIDFASEKMDDHRIKMKDDLVSGLINLGFPSKSVIRNVDRAMKENTAETSFEIMLKKVLRSIRKI